jgi:hypothetical protein
MILNVEKNSCHQIPMTCDGATWQYQNPPCGIMRNFGWKSFYYSNINLCHPLWTFILNGPKIMTVAQEKFAMWHINYILEKNLLNTYLNK